MTVSQNPLDSTPINARLVSRAPPPDDPPLVSASTENEPASSVFRPRTAPPASSFAGTPQGVLATTVAFPTGDPVALLHETGAGRSESKTGQSSFSQAWSRSAPVVTRRFVQGSPRRRSGTPSLGSTPRARPSRSRTTPRSPADREPGGNVPPSAPYPSRPAPRCKMPLPADPRAAPLFTQPDRLRSARNPRPGQGVTADHPAARHQSDDAPHKQVLLARIRQLEQLPSIVLAVHDGLADALQPVLTATRHKDGQ